VKSELTNPPPFTSPHTHTLSTGKKTFLFPKRKLFRFFSERSSLAAAVFAFNWAISAYKGQAKGGHPKKTPENAEFWLQSQRHQLRQHSQSFHFFPLTATMIRIHIQFRFQLKVFIVAGSDLLCETWQLLFKRFMPENGRLS